MADNERHCKGYEPMSLLSRLDATTLPYSVRHIQSDTQRVLGKAFNQNQLGYKQTVELDRLNLKTHAIGDALELNTIARRVIRQDPIGKVNRQLDSLRPDQPNFTQTIQAVNDTLVKLPTSSEAFRLNNTQRRVASMMPEPVKRAGFMAWLHLMA
jgi:hypothetical protein